MLLHATRGVPPSMDGDGTLLILKRGSNVVCATHGQQQSLAKK